MFPALLEKLARREDLTLEEASAAMAEVMEGRAAPAGVPDRLQALQQLRQMPQGRGRMPHAGGSAAEGGTPGRHLFAFRSPTVVPPRGSITLRYAYGLAHTKRIPALVKRCRSSASTSGQFVCTVSTR